MTLSAIEYHNHSKHSFTKYAASSGYLDWETQPDPFRFYEGTENIELELIEGENSPYEYLFQNDIAAEGLTRESVARFFQYSLALAAWKSIPGSQWPLRINPSSGNLHPTEAHIIIPECDGILSGAYHYCSFSHNLEKRRSGNDTCDKLIKEHYGKGFLVALSSIYWRESWKYGERAFRYCNHDVGHALAALRFSASLLGWNVKLLNGAGDDQIVSTLGFDQVDWNENEDEVPDCILFVSIEDKEIPRDLPKDVVEASQESVCGTPNVLSESQVRWDVVYDISESCKKKVTLPEEVHFTERAFSHRDYCESSAEYILKTRRSAQGFIPNQTMEFDDFICMLDRTLPRAKTAPFDLELSEPCVNLALFVHGVNGLEPGLYIYMRNSADFVDLQNAMNQEFEWKQIGEFPLFLLAEGNVQGLAARLSCTQSIAGDSCFSLGMIARFADNVDQAPYKYKHLFWEAGMIGQVLYLEAEAHGYRGTGIGCYFDDPVHELLGIKDNRFQSMYHFTVGVPEVDNRISTLPPYYHLEKLRAK